MGMQIERVFSMLVDTWLYILYRISEWQVATLYSLYVRSFLEDNNYGQMAHIYI